MLTDSGLHWLEEVVWGLKMFFFPPVPSGNIRDWLWMQSRHFVAEKHPGQILSTATHCCIFFPLTSLLFLINSECQDGEKMAFAMGCREKNRKACCTGTELQGGGTRHSVPNNIDRESQQTASQKVCSCSNCHNSCRGLCIEVAGFSKGARSTPTLSSPTF